MAAKTGAGSLDHRVAFDKQGSTSDGAGGTTTAFAEQFRVWTGFTHLRGGEAVMAARLGGTHTVVMRVRASTNTRLVTTEWRTQEVRSGVRSGEIYNVRDITPSDDRAFLDFLCEGGVAP